MDVFKLWVASLEEQSTLSMKTTLADTDNSQYSWRFLENPADIKCMDKE